MGRDHVAAIRFTCFSHFDMPMVSPPFGVIRVEYALKWLKNFDDGVAVYDFSERLGRIRVGDVVYKEEEETSVTEIGSLLNGFEPVIADVRLSTETLLSTLRLFEKGFDSVMFSFRDDVLSISSKLEYDNKSLERCLKVSGRGKVDKQYFGLYHLLRYLKGIDRMGIKGIRLLFSEGPQEFSKDPQKKSPRPIIIEGRIKDMEITLYQAPRIE
uniref:Uncharacterized protein n=1 Tax=uncultured crenarchaeote TaxID=29281 RepID=H5SLI2_9CREN|nr:hypothetical protein HGMM_F46F11C07 [uncultured crenarchaeote]